MTCTGPPVRIEPVGSNEVLREVLHARGLCLTTKDSFGLLWLSGEAPWREPLYSTQAVNRLDGMQLITSKSQLADTALQAQWPFVPFSARTPDAAAKFPGAKQPFSWVHKSRAHRAVRVLPTLPTDPNDVAHLISSGILQRRLSEPMRFGGRVFDLGVYVLVAERDGRLVYWTFDDDVLIRFCSSPFVEAEAASLSSAPHLQHSWVVDDNYTSVWDLPHLETVTNATAARSLDCLRYMLSTKAVPLRSPAATPPSFSRLQREIGSAIGAVLGGVQEVLVEVLARRRAVHAPRTFELVRFDFMLHADGSPMLTEVLRCPAYGGARPHAGRAR